MNKKTAALMHVIWLALAVSLPFFSVSFGRINLANYHIPLPALAIAMILTLILLGGPSLYAEFWKLAHYRILFAFTVLIFITHGIGMLQSYPLENSLREFVKLSSSIVVFWAIVLFFPNDLQFLKLFFKFSAWATLIFLSVLLCYYGILIKAPYLGTFYEKELSPYGKNQLAWLLTVLAPYYLHSLFERRMSLFWLTANTLIGLSIIYVMSRAGWIAMFVALCFLVLFMLRDRLRPNIKMAILLVAMIILSLGLLIHHAGLGETLAMRIQSIYDSQSLPNTYQAHVSGKHSKQNRMMLMTKALSKFRENPWAGEGLATSPNENGVFNSEAFTHNDYLCILAETGLMGTIPFFLFLFFFAKQLAQTNKNKHKTFLIRAAQASFLVILILSNFINIYTSIHYWLFLALALRVKQISETSAVRENQS